MPEHVLSFSILPLMESESRILIDRTGTSYIVPFPVVSSAVITVAAITSAANLGLILCAMSNAETPFSYCLTLPSGNVMLIMSLFSLKSKIAKIDIFF